MPGVGVENIAVRRLNVTKEQNHIKVLLYHRIVDDGPAGRIQWSNVSVSLLRRHLELLNSWGFTPITFSDYRMAACGELRLPKRPVILTFALGGRDTYRLAFPLLKEFGVNGVVFAVGDRRIRGNEGNREIGFDGELLAGDDELAEMHGAGFEIGSCSMTHPDLRRLPEQEAWEEIAGSKAALESILQAGVCSFAYPFGAVNGRLKAMVARAGYAFGCGIDSGPPVFGADPFNIRRIAITGTANTLRFAVTMLTPYELSEWARSRPDVAIRAAWRSEAVSWRHPTAAGEMPSSGE